MNAAQTLDWLKRYLPTVTPQVRDEYVLGDPTMLRAAAAIRGDDAPDRASLIGSLGALFDWEAGGRDGFHVLALFSAPATSRVVMIRPAEGNPGRFVALAVCPYASEHAGRYTGHEVHGYGLPAYPVPDDQGSIGLRFAQCDYEHERPAFELTVPSTWMPYSWKDPQS